MAALVGHVDIHEHGFVCMLHTKSPSIPSYIHCQADDLVTDKQACLSLWFEVKQCMRAEHTLRKKVLPSSFFGASDCHK